MNSNIMDLVLLLVVLIKREQTYNKDILLGIISKLYIIHGIKTINAITIGSNIVQENNIN